MSPIAIPNLTIESVADQLRRYAYANMHLHSYATHPLTTARFVIMDRRLFVRLEDGRTVLPYSDAAQDFITDPRFRDGWTVFETKLPEPVKVDVSESIPTAPAEEAPTHAILSVRDMDGNYVPIKIDLSTYNAHLGTVVGTASGAGTPGGLSGYLIGPLMYQKITRTGPYAPRVEPTPAPQALTSIAWTDDEDTYPAIITFVYGTDLTDRQRAALTELLTEQRQIFLDIESSVTKDHGVPLRLIKTPDDKIVVLVQTDYETLAPHLGLA